MTATTETPEAPAADGRADRTVRRLARNLSRFASRHAVDGNAQADAVVEYVGRDATRIVLVGADGQWGDQVAKDPQTARKAIEAAGLTLHEEFPNDVALRVKTGQYEWTRMAGIQVGGPANA
ncbi:hypothetical protein [Yinghuangia seranimata]|uniref:hypothetical protein n=1 Tax=Yinghuangia seranimata TaxID=408067 RepID=UPI00248CE26A|nr:hypothetical protein [Yinghuangia seranimata]MDI2126318.1 hypothetical protein [Yinghuangia seranimata]